MSLYLILLICCVVVSTVASSYQIYKMVELDALRKGLKHPKFWGFFSLGGGNASGVLLYLIKRRKYLSTWTHAEQIIMDSRKKKLILAFSCFVMFVVTLIASLLTQY